jgi:hypothetical protein
MACLSNVISQLEASRVLLEAMRLSPSYSESDYLAKSQMAVKLENGLTRLNVKGFHQKRIQWIYEESNSSKLENLCTEVAHALERAVEQTWYLQQWASKKEKGNPKDGQTLALGAIHHLIRSFREFEVIPGDQDLLGEPNKGCVLQYLRKALQLVSTLSLILEPSWYELCEEMIDHLDSFHFDHMDNYKRAENPTLPGVIDDQRFVPSSHLPAYPGRPIIYRYDGLGGPGVLCNQPD